MEPKIPRSKIVELFEKICKNTAPWEQMKLEKNDKGHYLDDETDHIFEGFLVGIRCADRLLKAGKFPNLEDMNGN